MEKFVLMFAFPWGATMDASSGWPSCTYDWDERAVDGQATSSSSAVSQPCTPSPSVIRGSHAYMAWMAEMWDEDISLCLQEEELEAISREAGAPNEDEVPLPFGHVGNNVGEPRGQLTELLHDGRQLRGHPRPPPLHDTSLTASMRSSSSGDLARSSSSWEIATPFNGINNGASPSISSLSTVGAADRCQEVGTISASTSSSSMPATTPSTPSQNQSEPPPPEAEEDQQQQQPGAPLADEGITSRFGVTRVGRDRWHHLNGSVRCRRKEAVTSSKFGLDTVAEGEPSEFPESQSAPSAEPASQPVSFYGQRFEKLADFGVNDETSTTCGETDIERDAETSTTEDAETTDDGLTSSGSAVVGFWRHGKFVPRPRTPEEERAHRGGSGLRRQAKKQQRMSEYFQGQWRPAWLRQYASDKAKRENMMKKPVTNADLLPPEVIAALRGPPDQADTATVTDPQSAPQQMVPSVGSAGQTPDNCGLTSILGDQPEEHAETATQDNGMGCMASLDGVVFVIKLHVDMDIDNFDFVVFELLRGLDTYNNDFDFEPLELDVDIVDHDFAVLEPLLDLETYNNHDLVFEPIEL
eukprot:s2862_g8.t1